MLKTLKIATWFYNKVQARKSQGLSNSASLHYTRNTVSNNIGVFPYPKQSLTVKYLMFFLHGSNNFSWDPYSYAVSKFLNTQWNFFWSSWYFYSTFLVQICYPSCILSHHAFDMNSNCCSDFNSTQSSSFISVCDLQASFHSGFYIAESLKCFFRRQTLVYIGKQHIEKTNTSNTLL